MSRDSFDDLPILADLRDELERRFAGPPGWRHGVRRLGARLGTGLSALPVMIGTAAAVAVLVLALTVVKPGHHTAAPTAGHGPTHHPTPPPPQGPNAAASKAVAKADAAVAKRDPGCVQRVNRGQTLSHDMPLPALTASLGVLRRPASPHDAAWRTLFNNGWDAGAEVYVDYVREARVAYGKAFFLVPEGHITPFGAIPSRCYREQVVELRHEFAHAVHPATPNVVVAALAAQRGNVHALRVQTAQRSGLCFAAVSLHRRGKTGGVDMGCSPGTESLGPDLSGGIGEGDRAGGTIFAAIVPDGVASVTLHFLAGKGNPARDVTSQAVNNVVVFKIPPHTYHASFPTSIIRRDGAGHVISSSP